MAREANIHSFTAFVAHPLSVLHLLVPVRIYAYEVDGFGSQNLMDDANCPSLLSLPYLGYVGPDDALYQSTRKFVWSSSQAFWWQGAAGQGIGGPHAGMYQIWPVRPRPSRAQNMEAQSTTTSSFAVFSHFWVCFLSLCCLCLTDEHRDVCFDFFI